jgi:hypothetical protein
LAEVLRARRVLALRLRLLGFDILTRAHVISGNEARRARLTFALGIIFARYALRLLGEKHLTQSRNVLSRPTVRFVSRADVNTAL